MWSNFDTYIVSLLKAWYGGEARRENDFGFGWLPRISGDHSHQGYWLEMADGRMDGLFVMGQNPAVGAPNAALERRALAQLKWLVVRDMVEVETASFWKDSPEVTSGELDPRRIGTEVFFFPAAGHAEKDGTFTNTQRMLQWHEKAVEPPGDCRSDAWFVFHLGRRLKAKAAADDRAAQRRLARADVGLPDERIARRAGRRSRAAGDQRQARRRPASWSRASPSSPPMDRPRAAAGSIPASSRPRAAIARAIARGARPVRTRLGLRVAGRSPHPLQPRVGAAGRPAVERAQEARLVGRDAPANGPGSTRRTAARTTPPPTRRPSRRRRSGAVERGGPFIMHADGLGWLWVPTGLKDGPLPAHYEPLESPVENRGLRAAERTRRPTGARARTIRGPTSPDARFPHVLTTYRLTEHHTAGGMSRTLSHLAELQPALVL